MNHRCPKKCAVFAAALFALVLAGCAHLRPMPPTPDLKFHDHMAPREKLALLCRSTSALDQFYAEGSLILAAPGQAAHRIRCKLWMDRSGRLRLIAWQRHFIGLRLFDLEARDHSWRFWNYKENELYTRRDRVLPPVLTKLLETMHAQPLDIIFPDWGKAHKTGKNFQSVHQKDQTLTAKTNVGCKSLCILVQFADSSAPESVKFSWPSPGSQPSLFVSQSQFTAAGGVLVPTELEIRIVHNESASSARFLFRETGVNRAVPPLPEFPFHD